MSKKIRVLLVVSLCLNVLMAGIIVGSEGRRFIPRDKNDTFSVEMRKFRDRNQEAHQKLQRERQKAMDMVVYGPYDRTAYSIMVNKINIMQAELFKEMSMTMADILQTMDQDERVKVMKRLERRFGPMPPPPPPPRKHH